MASFQVTEQAEADVSDIIEYTLERWGMKQAESYADRIEAAYVAIAEEPTRGRSRAEARPDVLGHHIGQHGRSARHVVFYTYDALEDRVTVLRVLHDSMDFDEHLP